MRNTIIKIAVMASVISAMGIMTVFASGRC